ncbi:hypothetical protein RRG08_044563 [Elysia crispata]|uniref:Uncharacterized protein n=1 Tax=Elysia crispata TaxID=231223 RepID=A0AAE1DD65_9GAST|nr:hypothetical protein RRG08_044563 [Elysia crispata]
MEAGPGLWRYSTERSECVDVCVDVCVNVDGVMPSFCSVTQPGRVYPSGGVESVTTRTQVLNFWRPPYLDGGHGPDWSNVINTGLYTSHGTELLEFPSPGKLRGDLSIKKKNLFALKLFCETVISSLVMACQAERLIWIFPLSF